MIIRAKYLALPLVILCNSAFAIDVNDVNCNYSDKTQVESVGTIDGVRNYNSKATDYAEEKRICAVTFDAKVGEKWYKTKGFYIYGPEMSQNEACNKAKDKAKVKVLEQHTPQLVTSDVEHTCTEKTPEKVVKQDAQPIIEQKVAQNNDPDVFYHSNGNCYVKDTAKYPHCHLYNSNSIDMHKSRRHNSNVSLLNLWNLGTMVIGQW